MQTESPFYKSAFRDNIVVLRCHPTNDGSKFFKEKIDEVSLRDFSKLVFRGNTTDPESSTGVSHVVMLRHFAWEWFAKRAGVSSSHYGRGHNFDTNEDFVYTFGNQPQTFHTDVLLPDTELNLYSKLPKKYTDELTEKFLKKRRLVAELKDAATNNVLGKIYQGGYIDNRSLKISGFALSALPDADPNSGELNIKRGYTFSIPYAKSDAAAQTIKVQLPIHFMFSLPSTLDELIKIQKRINNRIALLMRLGAQPEEKNKDKSNKQK